MEIQNLIPNLNQLHTHFVVCGLLWVAVILVILLDLWDRCYTERKLKRRLRSHKLRDTMNKIAEYWRFMLVAFVVDLVLIISITAIMFPYISGLLCIGLACIEIKSMYEHARERKSGATKLRDILSAIIDCATEDSAKDMIKKVGEYLDAENSKKQSQKLSNN